MGAYSDLMEISRNFHGTVQQLPWTLSLTPMEPNECISFKQSWVYSYGSCVSFHRICSRGTLLPRTATPLPFGLSTPQWAHSISQLAPTYEVHKHLLISAGTAGGTPAPVIPDTPLVVHSRHHSRVHGSFHGRKTFYSMEEVKRKLQKLMALNKTLTWK